ncbi:RraA family protein [Hahella ganghwensis]|uniref:RraA family protein n=1 Tax=Hahella ganghwensis TaxID=286420 RepID=UPI00036E0C57|nr:RraA family protein [Hahella ganghwensis]
MNQLDIKDQAENLPYRIYPRVQGITEELRSLYQDIDAATVGHITDFGYATGIKPLFRPVRMLGNAVTVRIPHINGSIIREALKLSQPGDVLVIDMSGDDIRACWGELRTLAAMTKPLAGAVVSGCATDVKAITELGFPVYSRSTSALTTRNLDMEGEVNVPVSIGGATVRPGDLVLGDDDGLFFIDPAKAAELGHKALEIQKQEDKRRQELTQMLPSK